MLKVATTDEGRKRKADQFVSGMGSNCQLTHVPGFAPGLWPGVTTARSAEMPDDISEANELDFFTYIYKVCLECIVTSERRCCH